MKLVCIVHVVVVDPGIAAKTSKRNQPADASSRNAPASHKGSSIRTPTLRHTPTTKIQDIVMDAFDARLQFTSRLARLGAGQQAAKSCAQFALKHKEYHEDLHSCILEQLATVCT